RSFSPQNRCNRQSPSLDIVSVLYIALTIGISATVQATRRWRYAVRSAAQAETEKVNAELSFLKAQINPHFLFNTLNNIYSLALEKSDNTPGAVVKLSGMMRYVLNETDNDLVPLDKEINYLTSYIDLQRIRYGDS